MKLALAALKVLTPLLSRAFPTLTASVWVDLFMRPDRHPRPKWEQDILQHGEPFELAGGMKAWSFGQGPLILLAHGWSGRGSQFGYFIKPLTDAGFRVVIFDGPAHGDSPGTWTHLVLYAQHLISISDQLRSHYGPLHGVAGHSFGAAAIALALSQGMQTQRAAVIGAPFAIQDVIDDFTQWLKLSTPSGSAFRALLENATGHRIQNLNFQVMAENFQHVPGLVLHSHDDREVSIEHAQKIHAAWKKSKFVPLQGAGHYRILKNPEAIQELVYHFKTSPSQHQHQDPRIALVR